MEELPGIITTRSSLVKHSWVTPGNHSSLAVAGQVFSFPFRFVVLPSWQELGLWRLHKHRLWASRKPVKKIDKNILGENKSKSHSATEPQDLASRDLPGCRSDTSGRRARPWEQASWEIGG